MGSGITIVYASPDSDEVVAVWGETLSLLPLDRANFPGVFINTKTHSSNAPQQDLLFIPGQHLSDHQLDAPLLSNITGRMSCAAGTTHYVEIALAYDNTFCAIFGNEESVASGAMQAIVDASNVIYRSICVQLALVHLEAHCEDPRDPYIGIDNFPTLPCDGTEPPGTTCIGGVIVLTRFVQFWNEFRKNVKRDAAYFFSGFDDGSRTLGLAFFGAACDKNFAYGWIEGPHLYAFAHEVGHTLGAMHTTEGLMRPKLEADGLEFSRVTEQEITRFIDGLRFRSCISTSRPVCDSTCESAGTCSTCFSGNQVPDDLVACSPVEGLYRCVAPAGLQDKYIRTDCPPNLGFVRRTANIADKSIFCCKKPTRVAVRKMVPYSYPLKRNITIGMALIKDVVPDNTDIISKTLMRTKVVPNCRLSPRETATPTTSASSICGNTFKNGFTFRCTAESRIGQIIRGPNVLVEIFISQRGGSISVSLRKTATTDKVINVGVLISTDANLQRGDVTVQKGSLGMLGLQEKVDPFDLDVPVGRSSCCGGAVFVYITAEKCNQSTKNCKAVFKKMSRRMRCIVACKGKRREGIIVPFSKMQECPTCRIPMS